MLFRPPGEVKTNDPNTAVWIKGSIISCPVIRTIKLEESKDIFYKEKYSRLNNVKVIHQSPLEKLTHYK